MDIGLSRHVIAVSLKRILIQTLVCWSASPWSCSTTHKVDDYAFYGMLYPCITKDVVCVPFLGPIWRRLVQDSGFYTFVSNLYGKNSFHPLEPPFVSVGRHELRVSGQ